MPTDLTTVRDHPVNLLEARWDRDHTNSGGGCQAAADADTIQYLRQYEVDHGVTFAALDNDALAAVREAYDREITTQGYAGAEDERQRLRDLEVAIEGLLGLGDA